VLIHSAASGTGLAAVQWAQHGGAEIFAAAGTAENQAFFRSLGVQHVYSSRTLDFAEAIREQTGGQGVDVVLNSLSGAAIPKSLELLGPYGRYIELSKKDIYEDNQLALAPFRRSLSFFAVDLAGMAFTRPKLFATLLHEVIALFAERVLYPMPTMVFPISQIADGFRTMAQGRHTGKIVLSLAERAQTPIVPMARSGPREAARRTP